MDAGIDAGMSTELLVDRARTGDARAQDALVRQTQDLVYNLAVRMLGSPIDAEDATQEILLKIVTRLDSYRGESAFRTWAYRVAANHLLTTRKRAAEQRATGFDDLGAALDANLGGDELSIADQVLLQEAKLICTSSMLVCLDRDHRIAFILGDILELPGDEAAAVLDIPHDAFRKRASRARARLAAFMANRCGLADEANPCRCAKQAPAAIRAGLVDPACLVWTTRAATTATATATARARVEEIEGLARTVEIFRGHPSYVAPGALVERLRHALDAGTSDLLR